jgi:methylthioribulose-1-phosphate dehydratase
MNAETLALHQQLVETIHFLHRQGWAPATSSNYSVRLDGASEFWVSASGIDKGSFGMDDLLLVDADGQNLLDHRRPSAETGIHSLLYRLYPDAHCVLHTHSVYNTLLSRAHFPSKVLALEGFEVLKGLDGILTHAARVDLPVFANTQDMTEFCSWVEAHHVHQPHMRGFLIAGHGFYTWGKSIAETKRHMEVFEFLFEVVYKLNCYRV